MLAIFSLCTALRRSFRNAEETVKVEVWDIVDEASRGEMDSNTDPPTMGLDASNVNVYQNAQAVIFLVNRSAPESFDYVVEHIQESTFPSTMSVLVLINFKDRPVELRRAPDKVPAAGETPNGDASGKVSDAAPKSPPDPPPPTEGLASAEELVSEAGSTPAPETPGGALPTSPDVAPVNQSAKPGETADKTEKVEWAALSVEEVQSKLAEVAADGMVAHCFECSMSNCFGLKLLYTWLNVPFLALKRANLLQSLQMLDGELETARHDVAQPSGAYKSYLEHLAKNPAPPPRPERSSSNRPTTTAAGAAPGASPPKATSSNAASKQHAKSAAKAPAETPHGLSEEATDEPPKKPKSAPSVKTAPESEKRLGTTGEPVVEPEPATPPVPGGIEDEMRFLNDKAIKGNALEAFFSDDEAAEESPPPSPEPVVDNCDDDSDDDFYAAPKFGAKALVPPPIVEAPKAVKAESPSKLEPPSAVIPAEDEPKEPAPAEDSPSASPTPMPPSTKDMPPDPSVSTPTAAEDSPSPPPILTPISIEDVPSESPAPAPTSAEEIPAGAKQAEKSLPESTMSKPSATKAKPNMAVASELVGEGTEALAYEGDGNGVSNKGDEDQFASEVVASDDQSDQSVPTSLVQDAGECSSATNGEGNVGVVEAEVPIVDHHRAEPAPSESGEELVGARSAAALAKTLDTDASVVGGEPEESAPSRTLKTPSGLGAVTEKREDHLGSDFEEALSTQSAQTAPTGGAVEAGSGEDAEDFMPLAGDSSWLDGEQAGSDSDPETAIPSEPQVESTQEPTGLDQPPVVPIDEPSTLDRVPLDEPASEPRVPAVSAAAQAAILAAMAAAEQWEAEPDEPKSKKVKVLQVLSTSYLIHDSP